MKSRCANCSKLFDSEESLTKHIIQNHPEHVPTEVELDAVSRQALWAFLNSDGVDRGLLAKAKQANTYRSTQARHEQTEGARQATVVMMARELAQDKQEFRDLLKRALPGSPLLVEALTETKPN